MKLKLSGEIKDSQMSFKDPSYAEKIKKFSEKNDGKLFMMEIVAVKDLKSYEQLKYYWGVLLPSLMAHTGVGSKTEMDAFCRYELLSEFVIVDKKTIPIIKSLRLSELETNKIRMSEYIGQVEGLLLDMGGHII